MCQINLFYCHYHIYQSTKLFIIYMSWIGGSNYDSLFARTVAYPVQVAYWTKEVIAPCGYSVPCQF